MRISAKSTRLAVACAFFFSATTAYAYRINRWSPSGSIAYGSGSFSLSSIATWTPGAEAPIDKGLISVKFPDGHTHTLTQRFRASAPEAFLNGTATITPAPPKGGSYQMVVTYTFYAGGTTAATKTVTVTITN
jgi:hypothetical protein